MQVPKVIYQFKIRRPDSLQMANYIFSHLILFEVEPIIFATQLKEF